MTLEELTTRTVQQSLSALFEKGGKEFRTEIYLGLSNAMSIAYANGRETTMKDLKMSKRKRKQR